ncbi:mannosyltransferase PIG-V [Thermosporothrix hazakensis]|jgi:Gpi18-like mannosyltransferase|uniref:Mannosyltransferase PIG-V n=1 Tax=Thermosporothrix hazakensis TaxID=644383 RepID=A0A326UCN1_THEHA|nr:mannosyltransferase PIG-V [Thermosporothrix hazakensis]GCE47752.1 hypothetical protein KTH_26210 [Thermosporothrix hazakensis]
MQTTTKDTSKEQDKIEKDRKLSRALPAFLAPWFKATLSILPIYLITRFVFLLLTYFGGILFFVPNYWTGKLSASALLYTWHRWDAVRFTSIAADGYLKFDNAAFFPLFPALMRLIQPIMPSHSLLLAGMVISNLAFLGVLVVLFRLVETEFDRETAHKTVLYLSIFPTAHFFFAAYNESLFIFFMIASFYAMRRGAWWTAAIIGALSMLTRSIGTFVAIIFVCEYARQHWPELCLSWRERRLLPYVLRQIPNLIAVLLIPLALGIYMLGLYYSIGDPLAFMHAQVFWRESLSFPLVAIYLTIEQIVTHSPFTFFTAHNIIDLVALLGFLVLLLMAIFGKERFARHQWTFILFGLLALVYSVLWPSLPRAGGYDPLASTQRFVLEIFAGFIILARLGKKPWFHNGYLMISLPLLAFFTLQFMTGHWTV